MWSQLVDDAADERASKAGDKTALTTLPKRLLLADQRVFSSVNEFRVNGGEGLAASLLVLESVTLYSLLGGARVGRVAAIAARFGKCAGEGGCLRSLATDVVVDGGEDGCHRLGARCETAGRGHVAHALALVWAREGRARLELHGLHLGVQLLDDVGRVELDALRLLADLLQA